MEAMIYNDVCHCWVMCYEVHLVRQVAVQLLQQKERN